MALIKAMVHHRLTLAVLLLAHVGCAISQPSEQATYSTREQLRSCLIDQDGLREQFEVLMSKSRARDAELKRWQDEIKAHVNSQSKLDTSNRRAVDAYNRKIEALNARIGELNLQAYEFNREQLAYNKQIAASNERCGGMLVTAADYEAVANERAAEGKDVTKPSPGSQR